MTGRPAYRLPLGLGRLRRMSWPLLAATAGLMALGVAFVFSANSIRESLHLQTLYRSQARMAVAGMGMIGAIAYFDYRKLSRWAWLLYIGAVLLLAAVPVLGEARMGARRWVFGVQPSEPAKLALIVLVARVLGSEGGRRDIWGLALALGLAVPPLLLILKQPDLGTALIFPPIVMLMGFVSGAAPRAWWLTLALAVALGGGVLGAVALQESTAPKNLRQASTALTFFLDDYQRGRLVDALYPDRDPLNLGWNRRQSLIAVGSGGVWGKGFLKGDQNLLGYLPQQVSANDFIFSVLAEEKGFAGAMAVLALYFVVIASALAGAFRSADKFGILICTGVAALFFGHVFINIAMTIGLLPVTGLPLPFLSYGRTFMVTALVAVGLIQSVLVHTPRHAPR